MNEEKNETTTNTTIKKRTKKITETKKLKRARVIKHTHSHKTQTIRNKKLIYKKTISLKDCISNITDTLTLIIIGRFNRKIFN